jgi:energy-coupling factor transport system ATP-binding protein
LLVRCFDIHMNSPPALFLQDVHFTYRRGTRAALEGIGLEVPEGAFIGIVGANGAGKSTLSFTFNRIVPGFFRGAFKGMVKVFGADVSSARVADMVSTVGMVFQDFEAQIFSTSVRHEVAFVMENLGVPRRRMLHEVTHWLQEMALNNLTERDPATLSGGQKQRLALASVLAAEPPVLVLDEPTTDLDPIAAQELIRCLLKIAQAGRTVVLVTHDLETLACADTIVVMSQGTIVGAGKPEEMMMQVEMLQRHSVRPPQLATVFAALGIAEYPASPKAAAQRLVELGFTVERKQAFPKSSSPKPSILVIEDLQFSYRPGDELFQGLKLAVGEGECVALLGPNGSGKTTLLSLISGIRGAQGGSIHLGGQALSQLSPPERAKLVGIVFQNPDHQIFQSSCLEEVAFGLHHTGVPAGRVQSRAMAALEVVNLADKSATDPFTMTKGERKKLALASVLACEPRLLLLDEPTTGLDAKEQDALMDLVASLVTQGHTVVFITHSISLAARHASRIVVMSAGRVIRDGHPLDVLHDEVTLAKAGLIAPPAVQLGKLLGTSVRTPDELTASLMKVS